jgi:glycosyltransferase involved in cell wall biosynthesis
VVATPCGSAPEIVEDGLTGYLRTGRVALARALLGAATLDRAACRASARHRFDTGRMVDDHIRVYTDLVPAAPGRGGRESVAWLRPR